MSRQGADIERLGELGTLFQRRGRELAAVGPWIATSLNGVRWVGPDAQAFRSAWSGEHGPALQRVADRLTELGETLGREVAQQSGASGGQPGPGGIGASLNRLAGGVADWLGQTATVHAELSQLSTAELFTALDQAGGDEAQLTAIQAMLTQRLSPGYTEDLDGPGSQERAAALADEVVELGVKLDDQSSYPGREADETQFASLIAELEARGLRAMNDRAFDRERFEFDRRYEDVDAETRRAMSTQKLLLDIEHQRRTDLSSLAANAIDETRDLIDKYRNPFDGSAREAVDATIQGVLEGGPAALARFADQLNTMADAEYGSKLNRYIQNLSAIPAGSETAERLRDSLASTGGEVFDFVAEGPSFANEVVLPTVSAGLDHVPLIGNAKGLIEGAVGYDMTGNELSAVERSLGVLGPLAGAAKKGAKVFKALDEGREATRAADKAAAGAARAADDGARGTLRRTDRAVTDAEPPPRSPDPNVSTDGRPYDIETSGLDIPRVQKKIYDMLETDGPDSLVKIVPRRFTPATEVSGYVTQQKFVTGRTPEEIADIVGRKDLKDGVRVYSIDKNSFEAGDIGLRGYTYRPDGKPLPDGVGPQDGNFPVGRGAPQWEFHKDKKVRVSKDRGLVEPGDRFEP